jgi:hypothetical protein
MGSSSSGRKPRVTHHHHVVVNTGSMRGTRNHGGVISTTSSDGGSSQSDSDSSDDDESDEGVKLGTMQDNKQKKKKHTTKKKKKKKTRRTRQTQSAEEAAVMHKSQLEDMLRAFREASIGTPTGTGTVREQQGITEGSPVRNVVNAIPRPPPPARPTTQRHVQFAARPQQPPTPTRQQHPSPGHLTGHFTAHWTAADPGRTGVPEANNLRVPEAVPVPAQHTAHQREPHAVSGSPSLNEANRPLPKASPSSSPPGQPTPGVKSSSQNPYRQEPPPTTATTTTNPFHERQTRRPWADISPADLAAAQHQLRAEYAEFRTPRPGIRGLIEAYRVVMRGIAEGWVTRAHVAVFNAVLRETPVAGGEEEWLKNRMTI